MDSKVFEIIMIIKVKEAYSSLQAGLPSPLRELTYHTGSHSVTCHPAEVTFTPLPQLKLVLDLATPEGCKAELTYIDVKDLNCHRSTQGNTVCLLLHL